MITFRKIQNHKQNCPELQSVPALTIAEREILVTFRHAAETTPPPAPVLPSARNGRVIAGAQAAISERTSIGALAGMGQLPSRNGGVPPALHCRHLRSWMCAAGEEVLLCQQRVAVAGPGGGMSNSSGVAAPCGLHHLLDWAADTYVLDCHQ